MDKVQFDYSELRGRIISLYGKQKNFAKHIKMGETLLSDKLNNKVKFSPDDIYLLCAPDVLNISPLEIGRYFFTPKV